jgi:hypothetical protein
MRRAIEAFEKDFERWGLCLPADAIEAHRGGQIREAGWSIRYNFGQDVHGEYMDYYASPRDVVVDPPGDDWHVRLYASGDRAVLPTVLEAYMYGRDPTWEELERTRRQFAEQLAAQQTSVPGQPARPSANGAAAGAPAAAAPKPRPSLGTVKEQSVPPRRSGPAPAPKEPPSLGSPAEAEPAPAEYLPLDIGLDVEFDLGEPVAAGEEEAAEDGGPEADATQDAPMAPPPPEESSNWIEVEHPDAVAALDLPGGAEEPDSADGGAFALPADVPEEQAPITLESSDDWAFTSPGLEPDTLGGPEISSQATESARDAESAPTESSAPPASLDEVNRDGLVLFYPSSDEAAGEPTADAPVEAAKTASAPDTPPADTHPPRAPVTPVNAPQPTQPAAVESAPREPARPPAPRAVPPAARPPVRGSDEVPAQSVSPARPSGGQPVSDDGPEELPGGPPAIPQPPRKKVFARADLVLTADVATIEGHTNPEIFRPWWYRPHARRIVLGVAAALVLVLAAVAMLRRHSRPAAEHAQPGVGDSSESAAAPGPSSSSGDSGAASATDSSPDAQPSIMPPRDSVGPALQSQPESASTAPPAATAAPQPGGRSDDAVARPLGPGSAPPPIMPSRSGTPAGSPAPSTSHHSG